MPAVETTCCFTGHRAAKLPWKFQEHDPRCIALKQKIYDAAEAVYASGVRHYICGMANGCDLYFGEAVLQLRRQHPEITLEAAVPYEGQARTWPSEQKVRWDYLYDACDYQTIVSHSYTPDCMMRRNRYMVDNSAVLIAAYSGASGGTLNTMLYAMRKKREVIQILIEEEQL